MNAKGRRKNVGLKGSASPHAKLNEAQVAEIRRLYVTVRSQHELARRYGVTRGTIQAVVSGKSWRHVHA